MTLGTIAVVVSYNGRETIESTVHALRQEVGRVHIVDNGSDTLTMALLSVLETYSDVTVERLEQNRGIGHALNAGLRLAIAEKHEWLLTMDQDSLVKPGFMRAYYDAIAADASKVCLTPRIETGVKRGTPGEGGVVKYAITSGNLVRADVAQSVGGYDEGLFIDCVDFDFSLRLRRAGHRIHRVEDARLEHRLGENRAVPLIVRRFYVQHSPVRRYYMFRNCFYIVERHLLRFPGFVLKLFVLQLILLPLALMLDPNPRATASAIARGMFDWLRRYRGRIDEDRA